MMRKIVIAVSALLVVFVAGGLFWYGQSNYGGQTYYTQVTTDGQQVVDKAKSGEHYRDYAYTLKGYTQDGQGKTLHFKANKERPLRRNAYLKLVNNDKKGVISWQSVAKKDVPAKALAKLNQ
ncbi:YxeA family protein [Lacticaseibacillus zhaodongensis]|uniref:YxeA family protein n=1 Tax=Lacticaseibacillus zhaodongensis TaxID=2668065 RepID=UPI001E3F6062|nr:YxeA family protein [Lacticaseibacillus zhaodongensis]